MTKTANETNKTNINGDFYKIRDTYVLVNNLYLARDLLKKGYRMKDITNNNNKYGRLVFFFYNENGIEEELIK